MKRILCSFTVCATVAAALPSLTGASQAPTRSGLGYANTPLLPGGKWRVHDGERPQPPVVTPGAMGSLAPPADAIVLFDGKDLSQWRTANGQPAKWRVEDGAMVAVRSAGDVVSTEAFGDVQLHVEWAAPAKVEGDGQGRGNSGVFLMRRYEIQVLDSFDNPTYPDGQAAAIYGQFPPLVNASRKPGEWQSFDITFIAPRFNGTTLVSPARVSVLHNGVLVHHDTTLIGGTAHQVLGTYSPHPEAAPIHLQDHGNAVRFRNIWARRLKTYDAR